VISPDLAVAYQFIEEEGSIWEPMAKWASKFQVSHVRGALQLQISDGNWNIGCSDFVVVEW
jgi:hypothetical protein